MSKYTTQLRFLCESLAGRTESAGYNSINEIIELARPKIFSFEYPIFDSNYKKELETKFIKRYYTREICAETFGRWQLFLESRLIEIMPYYNELYKTTLKDFDIFEEVNYSRIGNRTSDETGENTGNVTNVHTGRDTSKTTVEAEDNETSTKNGTYTNNGELWQKYSDTPQGSVQNIDNDSYLTNATKNTEDRTQTSAESDTGTRTNTTDTETTGTNDYTDTNTNSTESTRNVLEEYSEIIKGKYPGKSYMQLIQEFRETLLNIDKMILDELSDLFMLVY